MGNSFLPWFIAALFAAALVAAGIWIRRVRRAAAAVTRRLDELDAGRPWRAVTSRVPGSVGSIARILDRVVPRLEERLHRLEVDREQLRLVLSGMSEGVVAVDMRRRLLFANASAYRLFNLDDSAVGRFLPELIRSPQIQKAIETALATNDVHRGETTVTTREGNRSVARILAVQGTPLPGPVPSGVLFVFHDVTELRRLETLRQDFVANVSHELKTPLASIKAYTETLLDWALNDESVNEKFLRRIDEQADRLHQLIQDLLSLARLESGDGVYQHEPLEVLPAVLAAAETHRGRAEAKELEYHIDVDGPLEGIEIRADEEALRQILDNLIDNAIKYTPAGGWVRVSCGTDGSQVVMNVADSGIGIPRDDLPRIFERFYRVDKARSRELGGTGLGLSIVKHLVQSIGGQINVASRLGEGTRFTLRFPRLESSGTHGNPPTSFTHSS